MTIRNLQALLRPASVALIGASASRGSIGAIVLENIVQGGFPGKVYAVNPHGIDHAGVTGARSIEALPEAPDLAIVMTPAETVPGIIAELGKLGTKCAVVISAGVTSSNGLRQRMLDAAKPHLLRIVGPNCLGIAAPHASLNATFARTTARRGRLGLISQSGALVTAMLDWADSRGIGFSGIVSVGDMADVDIGDLVDLFAVDPATDAILLYVEAVSDAAKFLSAARAAALAKPVIAIKVGRSADGAKAAFSHTGALAGSYDVYRAAFERAGIVMVDTLTELFDAAQILCQRRRVRGERLGIVTNGGGAGILAVDALGASKARLATPAPETLTLLDKALPPGWSHGNPVDVLGDAGPERYHAAVGAMLRDKNVDAVLVLNCPTAAADPLEMATAVIEEVTAARTAHVDKPVLACWLGDANAGAVGSAMADAALPLYSVPDDAIRGFGYLLAARRAHDALTDAPVRTRDPVRDVGAARAIIVQARAEGRTLLGEVEAKTLLAAYGVSTVPTRLAPTVETVERACAGLNSPFAVKIVSPDLPHKSDVGGVALALPDPQAAAAAARDMAMRIAREHPDARIEGYAVEEMVIRPQAHEVFAGIATDPTFGPLVMVGAGGTGIEIIADRALTPAPIDDAQARALIDQTRISRLLAGYRNVPRADLDGLADVLNALSALAVDIPDVSELDINPLLVDAEGVVAIDARIRITAEPQATSRLAIRPVPMEWQGELRTRTGRTTYVRPVRPDDEPLLAEFFARVTPDDLRFRFLGGIATVGHDRLAMMTRVDYRRTISFLAFDEKREHVIATAMLATDPDRVRAEVALTTRSDMKGQGLSWALLEHVLRYAKAERITVVDAIEYADHEAALRMEREMGFSPVADPGDQTLCIMRRDLTKPV